MRATLARILHWLQVRLSTISVLIRYIVARLAGKRVQAPPIFVVGCPHSGTTLLLRILDAHSRIHAIPFESELAYRPPRRRARLLRYFDWATVAEGKARWVEKTPQHASMIPELLQLCPKARVIFMVRDGRDVACSIKARTGSFQKGMRRWISDGTLAMSFQGHPQVLMVKYETLIESFDAVVRDVLQFVDEQYEPGMATYYREPKRYFRSKIEKPESVQGPLNNAQYRTWQVNQPIFDGRGRWKGEMTDDEKALFKQEAGELLTYYGYAADHGW